MLSKITQPQKDKQCTIPLNKLSSVVKPMETKNIMMVVRSCEEGKMESCNSTGTKFQLCKMSEFQRSAVNIVLQNYKVVGKL